MSITALYLRKSNEDETGGISESIENQELFLRDYCRRNGFEKIKVYSDDGFSGTSFDRPAFRELIKDIEAGLVKTVLTKDYSRLGRNYIQTGYYCEQYFPEKGVRYIAVNDGIDTAGAAAGNDMAPFRAVFNDLYAKDISVKVRTALTAKKKSGQFIGAFAPYGYKKSETNKNRLVSDESTAPHVRRMFQLALTGESLLQIAARLTALEIPPPGSARRHTSGAWSDATVRNILTNETYIGNLTQNRCRKISYKVAKKTALPKDEWITVPDTHAPLVDAELFHAVNALLKKRTYTSGGKPHLLSGMCVCADCLSPMTCHKSGKYTYLVCSGWKKRTACTPHSVREDFLLQTLQALFQKLTKDIPPTELAALPRTKSPVNPKEILVQQIEKEKSRQLQAYRDKTDGILSETEYGCFSQETRRRVTSLEKQLADLENALPPEKTESLLAFKALDRVLLALLVRRILVGNGHITVEMNFTEPEKPRTG